jgi:alkylhydroperoxidase/carboxymuconolactone decarboxylase family protein YurZ
VSDDSTSADLEAAERAEIEEVPARLAVRSDALGLAARLNEHVADAASALDLRTLHLVRVAAMAAVGMPKIGWEVNLELMDAEVSADEVDAVLAAIAPIIGTARYLEAVTTLVAD